MYFDANKLVCDDPPWWPETMLAVNVEETRCGQYLGLTRTGHGLRGSPWGQPCKLAGGTMPEINQLDPPGDWSKFCMDLFRWQEDFIFLGFLFSLERNPIQENQLLFGRKKCCTRQQNSVLVLVENVSNIPRYHGILPSYKCTLGPNLVFSMLSIWWWDQLVLEWIGRCNDEDGGIDFEWFGYWVGPLLVVTLEGLASFLGKDNKEEDDFERKSGPPAMENLWWAMRTPRKCFFWFLFVVCPWYIVIFFKSNCCQTAAYLMAHRFMVSHAY